MIFKQELLQIQKKVDREIAACFDRAIRETKKQDVLLADALAYTKNMVLAGGKRLRPAMVIWGYRTGGGKNERAIIRVAAAIELVHIFFLIHDDIIDHGNLRHGIETLHLACARRAKKEKLSSTPLQFGESIALIVGDMVYAMAITMIAESGFSAELVRQALQHLQRVVQTTIIGQSQDLQIENARSATEQQVLAMYANKTARYTFEGPLELGMLLAENKKKALHRACANYALSLGVAFQIQDDILGIFGSEKKTGKSKTSDIAEGKRSLLIVHALKRATSAQRRSLLRVLGNHNASNAMAKEARLVIQQTGALAYAQNMALEFLDTGLKYIANAPMEKQPKEFFVGIIEFLRAREL